MPTRSVCPHPNERTRETSVGLFETREQGEESGKLVGSWIHDEKLETLIPNEPKITTG